MLGRNPNSSHHNMQETVNSLSNMVLTLQQQQALADERQESISNTLDQLTSMLHDIRNGPQPFNVNYNNTATGMRAGLQMPGTYDNPQTCPNSEVFLYANPMNLEPGEHIATEGHSMQGNGLNPWQSNNLQTFGINNNMQSFRWSEDGPQSNPSGAKHFQRPQQPCDVKLPPFNGREDWQVWINRFEAVARRRNWNAEMKLDNLLPRLQGTAGEFVFSQLSHNTISNYSELVRELNSRFRTIETQKTFAAKFSQRTQKHDETVEEYAAELKRLYSKAYTSRDYRIRQEDLVRRFLDGLKDSEAWFEIEFHKEPENIDEAIYHAVNYIQTKRRSSSELFRDKKLKKYAQQASEISETESTNDEHSEKQEDRAFSVRVPMKHSNGQGAKSQNTEKKPESNIDERSAHPGPMTRLEEMIKVLTEQVTKLQMDKGQAVPSSSKGKPNIICYACNEQGQYSRNCPTKSSGQQPQTYARNRSNQQIRNHDQVGRKGERNQGPLN